MTGGTRKRRTQARMPVSHGRTGDIAWCFTLSRWLARKTSIQRRAGSLVAAGSDGVRYFSNIDAKIGACTGLAR